MTKIDIISGFLGAGKTTFIQKLLSDALKGENVVLIENEFGEIGVDSGFLKNAGIEIREMNQGCICCSLVGDFESSLKEVIEQYHPDRILIEPSGVGKLSRILSAVKTVSENLDVKLDGAVTVVDAIKAKLYNKNFGEFFDDQIRFATSVVLSRMDIASGEKAQEAVNIVRGINPHANLITTALTELSGEKLLEIIGKEENLEEELLAEVKAKAAHHHEHHHDHEHHHEHHHAVAAATTTTMKRSMSIIMNITMSTGSPAAVAVTTTKRNMSIITIMSMGSPAAVDAMMRKNIIITIIMKAAVAVMTMMRMRFLTASVWKYLRR